MLTTRSLMVLSVAVAVAGCSTCPPRTEKSVVWVRPSGADTAAETRAPQPSEADRLRGELAAESAKRSALESALAAARSGAGQLERDANRAADLERQLAERDREIAALRAQLAGAASSDDLTSARQQLSARDQEIGSLKGQLAGAASAAELARARQDNAAKEAEVAALRGQLAGAASAADLARARQDAADKERELADLRAKMGGMVSAEELAAAKQRIAELEKELADRNAELAKLSGHLTEEQQAAARLRGDLAAQMDKLKEAQRGIAKALRKEVQKGTIHVDMRQDHLLVNLTSGLLFESGVDQLKPAGAEALAAVGGILKDYPEYAVEIGGHTDNVAIKGELAKRFATNKELSAARAQSALKALQDGGMANSFTTAGLADRRPVASNVTAEGRAKNRRVEVKVMPK